MALVLVALVSLLIGVAIMALYYYGLAKGRAEVEIKLEPFNSSLVVRWAALFVVVN